VDASGAAVVVVGDLPATGLLAAAAGRRLDRPLGVGPDERAPEEVVGFAPLESPAGRRFVRVDLPAAVLAGQLRSLRILSAVVLSVNGALMLLILLFTRHLLAPFETLLARARQVGEPGVGEGEVDFLLATFEKALAGLAQAEEGERDEIAVIERTLSASLQSGLLLLDRQRQVLAMNAVGGALLAIAPPAPGTLLSEALSGRPELRDLLAGALDQGGGLQREECTIRIGDAARTLGLTMHPLRRDDGEARGYLVLFADLTEARRAAEESRLSENLARLGELAGGVAHELRNSLATLRGYLTLIERRPGEGSIADFLGEIRSEADHLERVLEDFLSFARPGTARLREFPLVPLLQRAAADPALAGFPVRVNEAGAGAVELRGDPQLVERAVRNLLHNAVQAEREAGGAGPVEMTVQTLTGGVELVIEDRGPGIPPNIQDRLFHPFVTGRAGGVGLGLALAQRIVLLHGGRIRLEDRPGGGTRALVAFPGDTIATIGNHPAAS
jgi:signal transduction histidine kinase